MEGMAEMSGGAGGEGHLQLERIVGLALAEDLGDLGDITSQAIFTAGDTGAAGIIVRVDCVMSGLAAAREVCRQVDAGLVWLPLVEDGQQVPAGAQVARLEGGTVSILKAERTILNFLSHLSGVASLTQRYAGALDGLPTRVAATRKTLPGLRLLEKQAVVHGGGDPHRLGLYDAVLIKDNHSAAAGSVEHAVRAVREALNDDVAVEVEADTTAQLQEAIRVGADRVLLDNMKPAVVRECVELADGRAVIEVSGGITLENIRQYAEAGAQIISVGALTHSAPGIDFSLEMAELVW